MIDLHTHILPAIDDGAKNVEEALQMTRELYKQGVRAAVCTPHFDPTKLSLEEFLIRRSKALEKMKDAGIKLIPASETFLHKYLFHYADLSGLCIQGTRYMLLELPIHIKWQEGILDDLDQLTGYYDIIPIIAHVERYHPVKTKHIKALKEMGCLLQMNTKTILDSKTQAKALQWIKKDYIDVIGSDCHNPLTRPPVILEALHQIQSKLGIRYVEQLEYRADSILNGIRFRN